VSSNKRNRSPVLKLPEPTSLTFNLLPEKIRQSSAIGAEIQLPLGMPILIPEDLNETDKETLRQALFEKQVVVIRKQKGIDPSALPKLAKSFRSKRD
jgi:alpha-ketoglutarate-dependent taurine dioxygenase